MAYSKARRLANVMTTSAGIPTASIVDDAVTLAKMAAGTDGKIITYDASGNPVHVGPGTDGQVLTSTGAGSPPAFEDAGGGAEAAIKSSGANLDIFVGGVASGNVIISIDADSIDLKQTLVIEDGITVDGVALTAIQSLSLIHI